MTAPQQQALIEAAPIVWRFELVPIWRLMAEPLIGPAPTAKFLRSVEQHGILQPVLAQRVEDGPFLNSEAWHYHILDGRRRVGAAATFGHATIPAYVTATSDVDLTSLTAALHSTRSDNPLTELAVIEALMKSGHDEPAIARITGLAPSTIKRRLKLQNLVKELRLAVEEHRIGLAVAEAAARLPKREQLHLVDLLETLPTLTMTNVREERRVLTRAAAAQLPDRLFQEMPIARNETVVLYRRDLNPLIDALAVSSHPEADRLWRLLREVAVG